MGRRWKWYEPLVTGHQASNGSSNAADYGLQNGTRRPQCGILSRSSQFAVQHGSSRSDNASYRDTRTRPTCRYSFIPMPPSATAVEMDESYSTRHTPRWAIIFAAWTLFGLSQTIIAALMNGEYQLQYVARGMN